MMKSFLIIGREETSLTVFMWLSFPWKEGKSVKIDKQAAPPFSYSLATLDGLKSFLNSPFDGLAFFISAIIPGKSFLFLSIRDLKNFFVCPFLTSSMHTQLDVNK